MPISLSGSLLITGSLTASGTLTAQTLVVQTVTSSIVYSSGSNIFGNQLTNVQQMTGSLRVTGSGNHYILGGNVGIGTSSPGYRLEVLGDGTGVGELAVKGTGTDLGIALNNTGTGGKSWRILSTGGGSGAGNGKLVTYDGTGYGWVIDSSRNIGIGTSTPLSALDVRAASAIMGNYQTIQAFSTDSAAINLGGGISLGGYFTGTTSNAQFGSIVGRKENGTSGNYDGYLAFGTNAQATGVVERMRISSNGRVTITSSNTLPLVLNGTDEQYLNISSIAGKEAMTQYTQVSFSWYTGIRNTAGLSNTSGYHIYSSAYGGDIMAFSSSGAAALLGALTQNASDRRLKNNITNIPNALDKINKINGVTFTWENEIFKTDRTTDIGVLAQDIQAVLPDAVTLAPFDMGDDGNSKSGENYLTVYYEKLIPLLIEGIKELSQQNKELKEILQRNNIQ